MMSPLTHWAFALFFAIESGFDMGVFLTGGPWWSAVSSIGLAGMGLFALRNKWKAQERLELETKQE